MNKLNYLYTYKDIMVDRVNYILSQDTILPPINYWNADPFSSNIKIRNARSGYAPLQTFKTLYISKQREPVSLFQLACDTTLPKNLAYAKYKTIITQPEDSDDIDD